MTLTLLALLLADADTAVAKIGITTEKGLLPMFEVPLAMAEVSREKILAAIADLQVKVDTLATIYDACQPTLVTASTVIPGVFGKPRLVN